MKRREFLAAPAATVAASLSPLAGEAKAADDAPANQKDLDGETRAV